MIEFKLPSLGSDMDDGTLVEWRVGAGDAVRKGQVVAVVDTTKAAIDVECWDEGVVLTLVAEPGQRLPVGSPLALLRASGESQADAEREWAAWRARRAPAAVAAVADGGGSEQLAPSGVAAMTATTEVQTTGAAPAVAPAAQPSPAGSSRPRISPLARRVAREHGIDPASLAAPRGVVQLQHVLAALEGATDARKASGATETDEAKAANKAEPAKAAKEGPAAVPSAASRAQAMRQTIAAAMARSKREIPHYYLAEEIDFSRAAAWLAQRNAALPPAARLLPAALLLKAVALALRRYPEFNGFWRQEQGGPGAFAPAAGVHVGVAISLRAGGLVAPALHDTDRRDIAALTRSLLDLVKRTRAGQLRSSELADPTITVTNLGDQGVAGVFGVIYPPQVALVGFGRIAPRPVVGEDGRVAAAPMLAATLAADHRASDGHRGALLLAAIRDALQEPEALDAADGAGMPDKPDER